MAVEARLRRATWARRWEVGLPDASDEQQGWPVISSESHRLGRYTFRVDDIRSPDGSKRISWVYHVGGHAVATLALDDQGMAVLVREYRHPLGRSILDLPAGAAPGAATEEDLQRYAAKELAEEAGLVASDWRKIGQCRPLPGLSSLEFHMYLATGLGPVAERGDGEEWNEVDEVVRVPFGELYRGVIHGLYCDGPTILAVLWAAALGMALP